MLLGRDAERARIDRMLADARRGRSAVLVLRGEPGIGKTTLCRYAAQQAQELGLRHVATRGVESESELPFAGLSDLLRPLLGHLAALPDPQRMALTEALALGMSRGQGGTGEGGRFAVYAGALSLVAAAAEDSPLLAVADDVQWLDRPTVKALLFVARRLGAEGMALLFAVRDREATVLDFATLPTVDLVGLDRDASLALLKRRSPDIVAATAERLVDATAGNPLALTETPALLSSEQLAGRGPPNDPMPTVPSLERAFLRRVVALPAKCRQALLIAAAGESGAFDAVTRAMAALGLPPAALEPAETEGLVSWDQARLRFRHPLVRSAVYHSASPGQRRAAHRALADALQGEAAATLRAWHLSAATHAPDEEVASALEEAALDARQRGGPSVAARALERAARLSPDLDRAARRLLAGGTDYALAGEPAEGNRLLSEALELARDPLLRADIQAVRGRLLLWQGPAMAAHRLLSAAASAVEELDPSRAALMLVEAVMACCMVGDTRAALATARRAERLASHSQEPVKVAAGIALGGALVLRGDASGGYRLLARLQPSVDASDPASAQQLLGIAAPCYMWLERYDLAQRLLDKLIDAARQGAFLWPLPNALANRAELRYRTGRWTSAYADATESLRLADDIGLPGTSTYSVVCLARIEAAQGRQEECLAHVSRALAQAETLDVDSMRSYANSALGLLCLGLGRIDEAIGHLEQVGKLVAQHGLGEPGTVQWAPDLVEAYARAGHINQAKKALDRFEAQANATGRSWALATAARCRGMLSQSSDEADRSFAEALTFHGLTPTPFESARTQLCRGERLRRDRRMGSARSELRSALNTFERLGAVPWQERARTELRATGEQPAAVGLPPIRHQLTAQELVVALAVAEGKSNAEVAATLFVSPKTVEFHLSNVYRKLDLRSRTQLTRRLTSDPTLPHNR